MRFDPAEFKRPLRSGETIFHIPLLASSAGVDIAAVPYSIRVLLESALRNNDGFKVSDDDVEKLLRWTPESAGGSEIAFKPARVILQDFTGVPAVVDLAAMRAAMQRMGADFQD